MSIVDGIKGVLDLASLVKNLATRSDPIGTGVKIADLIYNKLNNTTGSLLGGSPTVSDKDELDAIKADGEEWAKRLRDATKNINDKNPVSGSPAPRFKDNKPIPKGDSPKYDLPALPVITFPKIPISKPATERDRVVPFEQKNSLAEMEWGRLISYPKIEHGLQLFEMSECVQGEVQELHASQSKAGFLTWLAINNGEVKRDDYSPSFNIYDQSALIIPSNLYNLSGDLNWVYGSQSIHDIYANMYSLSVNAYVDGYTLRGVAYSDIGILPTTDYTGFDLSSYSEDTNTIQLNGILNTIFRNFTGEKDNNNIEFILENINHGSVAKAVGANNTKPSLVPESLINYTDHDLQCLRYQQIEALKRELNTEKDSKIKALLTKEISRLEKEPIRRYREIHNLDDLVKWSTLAIHELIGDFPIKFRWEESDILQIGKQPQEPDHPYNFKLQEWESENVKITRNHSLASMLRDLVVASQYNHGVNALQLQQGTSNLIESGLTRQLAIKTMFLLESLHDWCGIATKQVKKPVNFTFNPKSQKDYHDFLTPQEMQVVVEEIDLSVEKSTLSAGIHMLAEAAQIIKAVHTVKTSPKGKQKWKKRIKGLAGNLAKNGTPENGEFSSFSTDENGNVTENKSSRPKTDFDNWCEAAESGFTTEGLAELVKKGFGDRPRITDVTNTMLDRKDG